MSRYYEKCTLDCFLSEDEKAIRAKYQDQNDAEYVVIAYCTDDRQTKLYRFNFEANKVDLYKINKKEIDLSSVVSFNINPQYAAQAERIVRLLSQSIVKPTIHIWMDFIDFIPTTSTFYRDPGCMEGWYKTLKYSDTVEEFEKFYLDLNMDLRIRCGLTQIQLVIEDEDISLVISKEDSHRVKESSLDYYQDNIIRYTGHKLNISRGVFYNALKETILLFKTKTINYYIGDVDADENRVLEIPILKAFLEHSYR